MVLTNKNILFTTPLNNGRLGNALWQVACVVGCAFKYNADYRLNIDYFLPEWKYAKYFKCKSLFGEVSNAPTHIYREPSFHYTGLVESEIFELQQGEPNIIDLHGYFQSEKYFEHCKEDVLKLFEFSDQVKSFMNPFLSGLSAQADKYYEEQAQIVSIHLRYGDYVNNPYYFDLHSSDYYESAISLLLAAKRATVFFVFSDDKEKAKLRIEQLEKTFKGTLFFHVHSEKEDAEIYELYMQSVCDANICANSSFSLWGAMLNKNCSALICPSKWFDNNGLVNDTKDLYPKNSIVI